MCACARVIAVLVSLAAAGARAAEPVALPQRVRTFFRCVPGPGWLVSSPEEDIPYLLDKFAVTEDDLLAAMSVLSHREHARRVLLWLGSERAAERVADEVFSGPATELPRCSSYEVRRNHLESEGLTRALLRRLPPAKPGATENLPVVEVVGIMALAPVSEAVPAFRDYLNSTFAKMEDAERPRGYRRK